ncbi:hypothetical protein KKC94_00715 [Patescibacteria group bacterium]|nr:hypothetical protein [Patescibacteria group bacterium]
MDILPVISIVLEALIALLALAVALKGRPCMLGFVVTFGIYVYYDLARHYSWAVSESLLSVMFFIATLTAFGAVLGLLVKKK